jgi:hypothetical protein
VRVWRAILLSAITTVWVVAGLHCGLEVLPGFEFLSCCQHAEGEKSPAHHENECNDDGCAAVERGCYKPEKLQDAPVIPLLALVAWMSPLPAHEQGGAFDHWVSISSLPPELPKAWQFFQRTALPPRAPSFVS